MIACDENYVNLIVALENDDVDTATRVLAGDFDRKFLQPIGVLRVNAVHLAAWHGRTELLNLLHENGADVNTADKIGRCALFHAAHRGNDETVHWLLKRGAYTESRVGIDSCSKEFNDSPMDPCFIGRNLPIPECWGRTPLHQAAKNNHAEVIRLLVNAKADANVEDDRGITPLLLAGSSVVREDANEMSKFVAIVETLVRAEALTNVVHPDTGTTPLHHAAALGSPLATKILLDGGAWPLYRCKSTGNTPVHIAATIGSLDTLLVLLDAISPEQVDIRDEINRTPLHRASYQGHHRCVQTLIDRGGNLAAKTKTGVTVIDAIFAHIQKPVLFLKDILDSRVRVNSNVADKNSHITVDFDVLAPEGELQMGVIASLIAAASGVEQLTILRHPLVETFLWLKWSKLRVFFFSLVLVHALFVLSLSGYSIILLQYETDHALLRRILAFCSCVLLFHNMAQVLMVPRYYLRQFETWLTFACATISLPVSVSSGYTGEIVIQERGKVLNAPQQPSQWVLHSISVAILLGWIQMMLLVGRLPTFGYYALMFSTVLKNILKVLLAFVCLIVGFALSFAVLFHGNDQFRDSWRAVVKTVVMMMGEYEYGALFSDGKNGSSFLPSTSRLVFLAFVMLASIVLMNLMIGLAVNDIQGLEKEGHIRQLLKQAEFVSHLEMLTSHRIFRSNWLHPRLSSLLDSRRGIPTKITFGCREHYFHESSPGIPTKLKESLFLLASRNARDTESSITSGVYENNNNAELTSLLEEVLLQLRTSYYPCQTRRKFSKSLKNQARRRESTNV
ncbi:transient receptor potential channel pyrexia-like [Hylaeus volcanicus]|uniref:transient receptor potential channel pyrexia-like n=1 Tax=Hylaeus volcanicus TaxID=313075 RepID=UPI0023B80E25|nr:transient receptor potential channel pyrexia-like [Hylaeus volcanicus]